MEGHRNRNVVLVTEAVGEDAETEVAGEVIGVEAEVALINEVNVGDVEATGKTETEVAMDSKTDIVAMRTAFRIGIMTIRRALRGSMPFRLSQMHHKYLRHFNNNTPRTSNIRRSKRQARKHISSMVINSSTVIRLHSHLLRKQAITITPYNLRHIVRVAQSRRARM